jgi:LuxR family maltose regulon positive regulatory protein
VSVVDRFTPALATALVGDQASASRLRRLEAENNLIIPLDASGDWYRLHHLLQDALRFELRLAEDARERELLVRAAHWHSEHGYLDDALRYAEASEDQGVLLEMFRRHWLLLGLTGQVEQVLELTRRVVIDAETDPEIALAFSYQAIVRGQRERVRRLLAVVEAADPAYPFKCGLPNGQAAAALMRCTFPVEGMSLADRAADSIRDLVTDPSLLIRCLAAQAVGVERWNAGDDACIELFTIASTALERLPIISLRAVAWLANILLDDGQVEQARIETARARLLLDALGSRQGRAPMVVLAEARLAQLDGDDESAAAGFRQAMEVGDGYYRYEIALYVVGTAIPLLHQLGDEDGLAHAVPRCRELLARHPDAGRSGTVARRALSILEPQAGAGPLAEVLSERERRVLRLLVSTELSRPQIARELSISPNTLKTHVASVYRKLGVSSREGAAERAAALDLG